MNKEFLRKFLINFFHSIIFIFSFLLILLFIIKFQKFGLSEDFPWLLATGKYILSNQLIPNADIFSWTNNGKDWIVYQWLFEIFIAFLTSNFNINFLLAIFILITFISYLFIPLWVANKENTPLIFTLVISSISLYVASVNLSVRPTVFTSLFLAVQFILLRNQDIFKSNRPLFFLLFFLTYVLWSNIHLVIFLGFGVLIIEIFSEIYRLLKNRNNQNYSFEEAIKKVIHKVRHLVLIFLFSFLGSLINPYGVKIYWHLLESTTANVFIHEINELTSPDFGLLKYQIFLFMTFVFFCLILYQLVSKKKIFKTADLFVLLALTFATFFIQRFVVWFCLFYTLIIPLAIDSFFISVDFRSNKFGGVLVRQFNFFKLPWMFTLFCLIFTPLVFAKNTSQYGVCQKLIPSVKKYLSVNSQGRQNRIFSDPLIGSCLLYEYPKIKVYGDTRFDFYGPAFVNNWISTLKNEKKFQKLSENKKLNQIFITKEWPIVDYLKSSKEYKKLFEDDQTIAFARLIE